MEEFGHFENATLFQGTRSFVIATLREELIRTISQYQELKKLKIAMKCRYTNFKSKFNDNSYEQSTLSNSNIRKLIKSNGSII